MRSGGPAAFSGQIAVGDVLCEVDGVSIVDMETAVAQLMGPLGSSVRVVVEHGKCRGHVLMLRQPAAADGADKLEGEVGIGVRLGWSRGCLAAVAVVEGGAAGCRGGVKEGDVLVAVDGRGIGAVKDARVVGDWLRGPPGSRVTLGLRRVVAGREEDVRVEVVRWPDLQGDEAQARSRYLEEVERAEAAAAAARGKGGAGVPRWAVGVFIAFIRVFIAFIGVFIAFIGVCIVGVFIAKYMYEGILVHVFTAGYLAGLLLRCAACVCPPVDELQRMRCTCVCTKVG
jgi:hypothetical protein